MNKNHTPQIATPAKQKPLVVRAVTCGICQSPADRYEWGFECQANPNHCGDLYCGIFTDLTYPEKGK